MIFDERNLKEDRRKGRGEMERGIRVRKEEEESKGGEESKFHISF